MAPAARRQRRAPGWSERGGTLVELGAVLLILAAAAGAAVPAVSGAVAAARVQSAAAELQSALHLARTQARTRALPHALVLDPDGRGWRIVEDPGGAARTVRGPTVLPEGVTATANATIQFSPKGFAVPFGTITVRSGDEVRRLIVNLLGRVRVAVGDPPS